jgi:hypothetical protein
VRNKLLDIIRFIIISPETVFCLLVIVTYYWWPGLFAKIGTVLKSTDSKILFPLLIAPIGGLIFALNQSSSTLKKEDNAHLLYEWKEYSKYRYREHFVYILCCLSLLVNILLWSINDHLNAEFTGFIYSMFAAAWLVGVFSMALAKQRLKAILGGEQ